MSGTFLHKLSNQGLEVFVLLQEYLQHVGSRQTTPKNLEFETEKVVEGNPDHETDFAEGSFIVDWDVFLGNLDSEDAGLLAKESLEIEEILEEENEGDAEVAVLAITVLMGVLVVHVLEVVALDVDRKEEQKRVHHGESEFGEENQFETPFFNLRSQLEVGETEEKDDGTNDFLEGPDEEELRV